MERLGVNVVSVVIGALFFLIAIAWVEAFRYLVDYVFFGSEGIKDYHLLQKKLLSALFVSALAGVLILFIYVFFNNSKIAKKDEKTERKHARKHLEDRKTYGAGEYATRTYKSGVDAEFADVVVPDFPGIIPVSGDNLGQGDIVTGENISVSPGELNLAPSDVTVEMDDVSFNNE